tara:strand:- start:297 stop:629 length:333 start_codon:yes stop_codon:yes gene_type:complete
LKRLLLLLLAAFALPIAVNAWEYGGNYRSSWEAEMACKNWAIEGGTYIRKDQIMGTSVGKRRNCYEEKEKNRWIGREVKKFKKDRTYKVDMFKLSTNKSNYNIKKYFKYP